MELLLNREIQRIGNTKLYFDVLNTGDISEIRSEHIRINNLVGNCVTGSDSNIFLRVYENEHIAYTPLLGVLSPSKFYVENNKVTYVGSFKGVEYTVVLSVIDKVWFLDIKLKGDNQVVDLIYGQGLLLNSGGSESYNAQYIDTEVFDDKNGYTLCSRGTITGQYVQIGTLGKNVGFSTDGFQFYGLNYKDTNEIKSLVNENLANEKYQYEYTFPAIQSEKMVLSENSKVVFYGFYKDGYKKAVKMAINKDEIFKYYNKIQQCEIDYNSLKKADLKININNVISSEKLTKEEINQLYPNKILVEKEKDTLLSFFTPTYEHVVLKDKELMVERPHGHIIYNKQLDFQKEVMATTTYIYGIFNSHIVVGNTNLNKLTSDSRNSLNVLKTSGQRIMIKIEEEYRLLNMPCVYELGFNYSKWIYKINGDFIVVKTFTTDETPEIVTTVESIKGKAYDFIILNELTMGEEERKNKIVMREIINGIELTPKEGSFVYNKYPNLKYTMLIDKKFEIKDDRIYFKDNKHRYEPFVIFHIKEQNQFRITTLGQRDEKSIIPTNMDFESAKEQYRQFYVNNNNEFRLQLDNNMEDVEKYNAIMMWYSHNALIHYITPHGLEQYGGAAWGTRDICQGPIEYFLATQHYNIVRKILLEIFQHQYVEDGTWPQWFMFDNYTNIQHANSHGDIIAWPLRTVALYLKTTGDFSILDEKISYTKKQDFNYTIEKETLMEHLKKEFAYIESHYIDGTYLSSYGDGDWNDSMQPANEEWRHNMVSGWTPILTYEGFKYLAEQIENVDIEFAKKLKTSSNRIKKDVEKYIVIDNVPAGFLLLDKDNFRPIIHPTDKETGIRYRLLPMNRGLISELYDKEEAEYLYQLIKKYLYREDGAILFSDPVVYKGGDNTYFQRAEQSSNVGREIGLHYVHAHLRLIEALTRMGKAEDVWSSFEKVNPILIEKATKNAMKRQANTYFSSSDANTLDRYEYMDKFENVRRGEIGVKGGWRIYSSGSGIYINQLVSNALGIKLINGDLKIAPVLPDRFNGLKFNYKYLDKKMEYTYHLLNNDKVMKIVINGVLVQFEEIKNPYKPCSALIKKEQLIPLLNKDLNKVDIYM